MTVGTIVKQPHYVWRFYLEAWEVNGKLAAYREGKVFTPAAKGVATEGGFHDLREVTDEDIDFLKSMAVFRGSPAEKTNLNFIDALVTVQRACKAVIDQGDAQPEAARDYAENTIRNFEERLQGNIEQTAIPWLISLRNADNRFIKEPENRLYYYFLAMQYFRTKRMMTKMVDAFGAFDYGMHVPRIERIWQLMRHVLAVNVGGSLHMDRAKYRTVFLRNQSDQSFLTGAQPIVNTYRTNSVMIAPEELQFYYPLGPRLAMLHTPHKDAGDGDEVLIGDAGVDYYNRLIVEASPDYFFADSREALSFYLA